MENQSNRYEKELSALDKETNSIVGLLMRFGVREKKEVGEKPLWDSRVAIWNSASSEIQKTNKDIEVKYKGTKEQNLALLTYIRGKILAREVLDPKTLRFTPVEEIKGEAERARKAMKEDVGPAPEPQRNLEDDRGVLKEISGALDRFLAQNKNRPFDTSVDGVDGGARKQFRQKGFVEVVDNISLKKYKVSKDPSKASTVKNAFDKEKTLTGTPALCDDVITEFLPQVGIRIPAERMVHLLEDHFRKHPETYAVFRQGMKFEEYGKDFKPSVPCRVGDIMTSSNPRGRHIFIITKVDEGGVPTEVMDSSAVNQGIGTRPFIGKEATEDLFKDKRGKDRSRSVIGPGITLNYLIRPNYKTSLQNLAKGKKRQTGGG